MQLSSYIQDTYLHCHYQTHGAMLESIAYFLHITLRVFGGRLWEKEERQVVEQKRLADPFRW